MLGFFAAVIVGSLLLSLPISAADGQRVPYIDALFTATSATCVTGLVTVSTATTWSFFGQAVILLLIQIGGLGIITIMSGIMMAVRKRMGIGDRLLLQDAFNLNTLSGLGAFVKKVVIGTLLVEGVGALLYMIVFVPEFGARGIWISVFNSVSAFCNAGMDVIGETSLAQYVENLLINGVTCTLIILGGIGYIVWWDVIRVFSSPKIKKRRALSHLTLGSKIAIAASVLFVFVGAALIFAFEYSNPKTIGDLSLWNKIQASVFQSVTTRTAGFFTIDQQGLTNASSVVCMFLMFIGGSPVGTAGGVKTVTVAVLFISALAMIKDKDEVSVFGRSIPKQAVSKAVAVSVMSFSILFISTVLLSFVSTDASLLDVMYESVSATATVGLTRNFTATLGLAGKIIIICTMYLGRVGPISLALALNSKKKNENAIKDPTEDISVG